MVRTLGYKLEEYEAIYGKLPNVDDIDVNARLEFLIKAAFEQTGQQAVIIIDEYDAPLLDVMNDKCKLPVLRQIMRNFYSPIKSLDPYLRFVFITGINKFAQLSIFSELNNLKNISMMPQYSAICGISRMELENDMKEEVQALADEQGVTIADTLDQLKANYDGYHFCSKSEDIYNPYSLLNACLTGISAATGSTPAPRPTSSKGFVKTLSTKPRLTTYRSFRNPTSTSRLRFRTIHCQCYIRPVT